MNINSSLTRPNSVDQARSAPPSGSQNAQQVEATEERSALDKFVTGAKIAGASMIPGIGGRSVLRPLAFQVGLNGDPAWKAMDAATLMNYASIPLLATSLVFPRTGLIGAGICLAASGVAGLYGANAVGAFD